MSPKQEHRLSTEGLVGLIEDQQRIRTYADERISTYSKQLEQLGGAGSRHLSEGWSLMEGGYSGVGYVTLLRSSAPSITHKHLWNIIRIDEQGLNQMWSAEKALDGTKKNAGQQSIHLVKE